MRDTDSVDTDNITATLSISSDTLEESLCSTLSSLCKEYIRLGEEISSLQETQKDIKTVVESLTLPLENVKKISGPGWHTTRKQSKTTSISPERLLERGVGIDVIEYATETKKGKEYVEIGKEKVKEKK